MKKLRLTPISGVVKDEEGQTECLFFDGSHTVYWWDSFVPRNDFEPKLERIKGHYPWFQIQVEVDDEVTEEFAIKILEYLTFDSNCKKIDDANEFQAEAQNFVNKYKSTRQS